MEKKHFELYKHLHKFTQTIGVNMFNSNLKDKLTMYAAVLFSTATVIIGLPAAVSAVSPSLTFSLPPVVNVICGFVIAISIVVSQVMTGKNPNGTTKTDKQVIKANKESELSK